MSTSQPRTSTTPQKRRFQFSIGCFAILLVSPLLLYYGYCWGFLGRNSLLLQHLFQCKCPASSDEWRYPDEVDVIVPACQPAWVELSPSGRFLAVYVEDFDPSLTYLLDLQTMERTPIPYQPFSNYLTDDLGFREYPEPYIVNRNTGKQFPIQRFIYAYQEAAIDGNADLQMLANTLQETKEVFLINDRDTIVALDSDFDTHPEDSFFINKFDIPGFGPDRVEMFLLANRIDFQAVTSFPEEIISPDGRFIARADGIYLIDSSEKIVEGHHLWVRGWTSAGRGAIYSTRYGGRCLLRLAIPMMDDSWCEIEVPQPVLLLKVPEEYLSSTQMP